MQGRLPVVRTENGSVSETVVVAVAEARGVDPTELEPRLYDFVDPDALDSLFRSDDGSVAFTMAGCHVTVYGSGRVVVLPEATEPSTAVSA